MESPLSQGRELKSAIFDFHSFGMVAPLAGARIEMARVPALPFASPVAPLAGARIEISNIRHRRLRQLSPLSQGRELKSVLMISGDRADGFVAPLAGARIEIPSTIKRHLHDRSPLSQGRELKLINKLPSGIDSLSPLSQGRELKWNLLCRCGSHWLSPLSQGRELKYYLNAFRIVLFVAPLAGGLIGIAYKLLSKEKNYNFHNYFFNFTTKKTAVSVWIRWFFCIFLFTGRRRPTGKCPSY